jgi:hypothetical protein
MEESGSQALLARFLLLLLFMLLFLIESKIVTKEVQAATRWREIGLIRS